MLRRLLPIFSISLFCLLLLKGAELALGEDKGTHSKDKVEVVGDELEYRRTDKKMIGRGNVVVSYRDVKLTADYAEVETETKKAYAKGHVVLLQGETAAAKGEEVYYDFEHHQGQFPNGRSVNDPWYARGKKVEQLSEGKMRVEDAGITTCDLDRPHYELRAKQATIYTGDKIFARSVKLYVLGKPVFWWPYVVIPLQHWESPIQIQPGYSTQYGAYLLTSKGFSLTKWLWGKWHLDWRSKRGFGAGADFGYHFNRFPTEGSLQMYLTQDRRAPTPGLVNPYAERENRTRGRLTWKHRTNFNPNTYLLWRYHRADDEFFLQDFFQREFRSDIDPSSFVNFTHNTERYGFYAFNQKRMNRYEDVVEHLPEIRFDWKKARFLSDRMTYESETSIANLNHKFSRSPTDENVFRADSFHEWAYPLKWHELKLTPSTNFRETIYSRDKAESGVRGRTAFGGAVDLRTQFYRIFNTSFDFLGMEANQLRHVLEPSIRYDTTLLSTISDEELTQFDAIDKVDDANRITFGLENRIQTKRVVNGRMQRVDWVSLNTFLSYDFHPDEEYSRSGFSTLTNELQLRPYSWLQFEIRADYDMVKDKFREFNQDLIARKKRFRVLVGHRYVSDRPFLGLNANNQFVFDLSYWLNTRWQTGGYIRWDGETHKLQEWQISATRDLHDFLLDFGYNVRNSDIHSSNKELFFLFRLKAFPEYPLKSGNRASFSEPRIGSTVAGSNQSAGLAGVEA